MTENSKYKEAERGVRIQRISQISALAVFFLLVFLAFNLHTVVKDYKTLATDFGLHMKSHGAIADLQDGSDNMTEQSRLFVVSHNPDYMKNYFVTVNSHTRENAYDILSKYYLDNGNKESVKKLEAALEESNKLMKTEIQAMKLVAEAIELSEDQIPEQVKECVLPANMENMNPVQKLDCARNLVFDKAYIRDKNRIDEEIQASVTAMSDKMVNNIDSRMKNVGKLIVRTALLCALLATLFVVVFAMIQFLVIRPIKIYIKCIKENRRFELVGPRELRYLVTTYNKMYDINEASKLHTEYLLEHDPLTSAFNRLAFEEQKLALSKSERPIALIVFDVDCFKNVNDTYGHNLGDQSLIKATEVVRSHLRSNDILARIGGDEFAVIMMDVRPDNIDVIGKKLNAINQILQNPENDGPKLSLSFGIAFAEHGYSEELFQQADAALYDAKSNGKCCYRVYNKER